MRCEQLMETDLACCWAGESVQDVAERMRFRDVGFMPVVDSHSTVVGTITDRDLTVRALADGLSPRNTSVGSIMSHGLVYCHPDDPISVAEDQMMRNRVSRVLCLDRDGRPVGVISLSDVAEREWTWRSGRVLRKVATREARS